MLEKLEELIQEREVIENIITLRRTRHAEQMEELKADYADKISNKTGALIMNDSLVKELDEKFENGIQEEFGKRTEIIDLKIEIANKEQEVENQSKLVADKKKEIEKAENEIEHEIIRQYFSKEGLSEQPIDRSHIEELKVELEALESKLGDLEKQKDELYAKLEVLEPTQKEEKVEEPVAEQAQKEQVAEEPAQEEPVAEEPAQEEPVVEEPAQEEPVAEEPTQEEPVAEESAQEEPAEQKTVAPKTATPKVTEQKTPAPSQPTAGKTEPVKPAAPVQKTSETKQPTVEQPKTLIPLHRIDIDINKDGSQIVVARRKGWYADKSERPYISERLELSNTEGLEEITKNKPAGDKYVIREVLRAIEQGKLTQEEGKEQVKLYTRILQSENEAEVVEIKKAMKLNLQYDLRGMRTSGLSKEDRKELEANAKMARDLALGEVEAPLYTRVKWAIQDFAGKPGEWLTNIKNKAKNLLPKRNKTEQLEAGREEPKTEEPTRKPGELSEEEKKVQQEVARTVAEVAAEKAQQPAKVDNEMSETISAQIDEAGDR